MSTEKWSVVVGEETLELSLDDLRALILDGRVKPTDRVKKEGLNSHNLLTGVGVIWLPVINLLTFLPDRLDNDWGTTSTKISMILSSGL